MIKTCLIVVPALVLTSLSGCSIEPSTSIKHPLTARPVAEPVKVVNDGAIYQPRQGVSLFEDRRPHEIGDIIRVNLVENTQITRKFDNKQNRTGNATASIPAPTIFGRSNVILGSSWAPNSASNTEAKTDLTNNNSFSGSITVTVTDILANGNLQVAGEKQISLDNDSQFIRLAGVVNPRDIAQDGTIKSTQLADVKLESKASTSLDPSNMLSMLSRFFLAVVPF